MLRTLVAAPPPLVAKISCEALAVDLRPPYLGTLKIDAAYKYLASLSQQYCPTNKVVRILDPVEGAEKLRKLLLASTEGKGLFGEPISADEVADRAFGEEVGNKNEVYLYALGLDGFPHKGFLLSSVCSDAQFKRDATPPIINKLPMLDWQDLAEATDSCSNLFGDPETIRSVADRVLRQIAVRHADFLAWYKKHANQAYDLLNELAEAIGRNDDPVKSRSAFESLAQLLDGAPPSLQVQLIGLLGNLQGEAQQDYVRLLRPLARSSSRWVATEAQVALLGEPVGEAEWRWAWEQSHRQVLTDQLSQYLEETANDRRSSGLYSAEVFPLPSFPWPPPAWASIGVSERDFPSRLFGTPTAGLGTVERHVVASLRTIDSNFDSGLFGVPGGFVLLTKLEQIDADGRDIQGPYRWQAFRPPPTTLRDYIVDLLLAPPGYYRSLAFVFTSAKNLTPGKPGAIPDYRTGAQRLPDDLAAQPLGSKHIYVLVYAFLRRDAGSPRPYTLLSARKHLEASGLIKALEKP